MNRSLRLWSIGIVKNYIFDDPIHQKGTNIGQFGHFGAKGDEIIKIRTFFWEKGLWKSLSPVFGFKNSIKDFILF